MSNISKAVNGLTTKAHKISKNFHHLINKSAVLLVEGQNVNKKIIDSCGVQNDQLLKNLVKYCTDEDRIHELLENAELKQTLDEYKAGIEQIMEKYKLHCQGNTLNERYQLREKYVAGLQAIANNLQRRIEEMTLLMIFTVGLEEHSSTENQRIIQQLTEENEMLRRQLQISSKHAGEDCFQQNQPEQVEVSTQVNAKYELPVWYKLEKLENISNLDVETESESNLSTNTDSESSSHSFHSFVTCYSYSCESQSTVSDSEQLQLIKKT